MTITDEPPQPVLTDLQLDIADGSLAAPPSGATDDPDAAMLAAGSEAGLDGPQAGLNVAMPPLEPSPAGTQPDTADTQPLLPVLRGRKAKAKAKAAKAKAGPKAKGKAKGKSKAKAKAKATGRRSLSSDSVRRTIDHAVAKPCR